MTNSSNFILVSNDEFKSQKTQVQETQFCDESVKKTNILKKMIKTTVEENRSTEINNFTIKNSRYTNATLKKMSVLFMIKAFKVSTANFDFI